MQSCTSKIYAMKEWLKTLLSAAMSVSISQGGVCIKIMTAKKTDKF